MKNLYLAIFTLAFVSLAQADEAASTATAKASEWDSNAELSLLLTSGNTDIRTFGLGLGTIYKPLPWVVSGKAGYLNSSNAGTTTAEAYTIDGRGERKLTDDLGLYVNLGFLKNVFAGFNERYSGELGLSYSLLKAGAHTLSTEAGLGVINESRTDLTKQTFMSARVGAEYKWKFSENADFTNTLSILDNLETTSDWRLVNTSSITAVLTSILSLKASFKVEYLNLPVTGKKKTDTTTSIALVAKF